MAYAWQSVEEAAVTLGVSTRTLHRRISKGEVETRLEDGRREVLVCLPDPPEEFEQESEDVTDSPSVHAAAASDHSTAIILAEKEVALANEKVRRTELALAAFQHTSSLLQQEATRTRISARCAWGAVAILSIGVYVAVGWTAAKLSETRVNNANLVRQLDEKSTNLNQAVSDRERYRTQRDQAQQAAARSEGELSATKAALVAAKKPATQPGLWGIFAKTPAD